MGQIKAAIVAKKVNENDTCVKSLLLATFCIDFENVFAVFTAF